MDTSQYKDLFVSEAREIITKLNNALVILEKKPDDHERLNEIFRQAHTLKGMAATMSYEEITNLTHEMEEILHFFRQGEFHLEKPTLDLLFECCDVLAQLIEEVAKGNVGKTKIRSDKIGLLIEKLKKSVGKGKEEKEKEEVSAKSGSGFTNYRISVSLRKDCPLKEARAFVVVKAFEDMGTILGAHDVYESLRLGKFDRQFEFVFATEQKPGAIKEKIKRIIDVEEVVFKSPSLRGSNQSKAEAISGTASSPLSLTSSVPRTPRNDDLSPERPTPSTEKSETQMVRVDFKRLDHLVNLVGELVINKIRLAKLGGELGHKPLVEVIDQMGRITDELQAETMQARLVPLDYILSRLPRMVRDLATSEDKEVELVVEGGEIGLDRTILDKINEPLIHLLRNAVSHGIESSAERGKEKKKRTGTIRVTAQREKNMVVIEVADDGRGMDPREIKKVAIQKALLKEEEASALSDEETFLLITLPGFSTSRVVTQTSGRGVGMNAVRTAVESIGGTLKITSTPGAGSTFTLKLPLMLAIVQALLVKVSDETYAIPMANIVETMKAKQETVKRVERREVIPYRETILPLIRLESSLRGNIPNEAEAQRSSASPGQPPLDQPAPPRQNSGVAPRNDRRIPLVVVELGRRRAGLVVDDLLTQQEVVIKSTTDRLRTIRGLAGATILGDGRVAMVLDVASILKRN